MASRNPYRIIVVCSGNICRSPMAELLLREKFAEAGLGDQVSVDSAGTTSWEAGNPPDQRTLAVLERMGHGDLGGSGHVARQIAHQELAEHELVLAADSGHLRELRRLARTDEERSRVRLLREFDPEAAAAGDLEMDDPWYGDDSSFDQTYAEIMAAADGVVDHVRRALTNPEPEPSHRNS